MELDKPVASCDCGGETFALPFFTYQKLALAQLAEIWETPLAEWGVGEGAVLRLSNDKTTRSFGIAVQPKALS